MATYYNYSTARCLATLRKLGCVPVMEAGAWRCDTIAGRRINVVPLGRDPTRCLVSYAPTATRIRWCARMRQHSPYRWSDAIRDAFYAEVKLHESSPRVLVHSGTYQLRGWCRYVSIHVGDSELTSRRFGEYDLPASVVSLAWGVIDNVVPGGVLLDALMHDTNILDEVPS